MMPAYGLGLRMLYWNSTAIRTRTIPATASVPPQ